MTSIVFSSAYYFNNEVKINFDKFVGSTTGVVNIFFTDIGKKDNSNNDKHTYLLRPILFCGHCERRMGGYSNKGNRSTVKLMYRCNKKHNDWIRIVVSFGCNKDTAEDIVQEAYLRIHTYITKGVDITYGDDINHMYVYRVLRGLFIDLHRKEKNIINLLGIESPGLTCCLAIGKYVSELVK